MSTLATSKAVESENIAHTSALAVEADFEAKCKAVTMHSTEACYIAFDRAANTGDFVLLADTMLDLEPIEFTRISALSVSTSGTLYLLARR